MRSFLKIFLTVLVLACAFAGYLLFQPKAARQSGAIRAPEVQQLHSRGDAIIGGGEQGWVRQFDQFGNLSSRFRLTEWEPPENGLVHVIKPEAELYVKGKGDARARISITGADGQVTAESLPGAGATDSPLDPKNANAVTSGGGPAQPPSSGRLNHVIVRVFETEAATEPVMTLKTNNIVFDNEAFRISTETYTDINGTVIPADQVAVIVEGRDFDFFGRGLTLRWNDVDQRLEYLRIAHGDKLVLKNPSALSGSMFGGKDRKKPNTIAEMMGSQWAPLLPMLASADPSAAGDAINAAGKQPPGGRRRKRKDKEPAPEKKPQTQPVARKPQPPYRAVFADQVRIDEGEQRVATADVMNVDFLSGSQDENKPGKKSTTRPATVPTSGPSTAPTTAESSVEETDAAASPQTKPTTEPTAPAGATRPATQESDDAELASTRPTSRPASQPTTSTAPSTAPAVQPITIYWVGELTVTPSTLTALPKPLAPGDAEVELIATTAPVVLTRDNSTVHCARAAYRTDGTLAIDKSEKFPEIVMTHRPADDAASVGAPVSPATAPTTAPALALAETKITTEAVWYSFADRVATLKGRSRVTAPMGSDPTDSSGVLDAAWTDEAKFSLVGDRQEELTLERADFSGAVDIKAPQGKVKSEKLALLFDPPPPRAADEPGAKARRPRTPGAAEPFANADQPELRRIIATEKVSCALADDRDGKTRTIDCDKLELETAKSDQGKLYPQVVEADGSVHASDGSEHLRAGHVVVKLKPAPPKPEAVADEAGDAAKGAEPETPVASRPVNETSGEPTAKAPATAEPVKVAARDVAGDADEKMASVVLESMLATQAVQVTSRDGAVATGDRLTVTMDADGARPHVELVGAPAKVNDDKSGTLIGKTIIIDPKTGVAHVPGEGSIKAAKRDEKDPTKPPVPVEVSWAEGADLDSNANHIDVVGKVLLRITEPDGTVRTATAGRVGVELVDKAPAGAGDDATTRPARARKSDPAAADLGDSMQAAAMKNKDIGMVTLRDDAAVDSQLLSPDGKTVLQRAHLKSSVVQYDVRTFHLAVPGPGQMLVENRSDPRESEEAKQAKAKAKADKKTKGADDADSMSMNDGATAFQWSNRMEFDKAAGRATMDGSVVVTHQPDDKKEPPVRIDADRLIAEFVPDNGDTPDGKSPDANSGQVASSGSASEGAKMPRLKIKSFSALGNILISRDGAELSAGRIDYDPSTDWVVARGSGRTPAIFTHPSGRGSATAGELWLNTKTWQVKVVDASTRAGGPKR